MTAAPSVRRAEDGAWVEEVCGPHQPVGILVSSPLNEVGVGRSARCWVVEDGTDVLGLLTAVRVAPGLTTASAVVREPAAVAPLAELARRCRASVLSGGADHVGPVAALVPGARSTTLEMLSIVEMDHLDLPWEERTRVATEGDVPALVALYGRFELEFLDPGRRRAVIAALVRQQRIVVALDGEEVVAAQRVEARSQRWDLWGGLTVPPERRGQGLSWLVDARARRLSTTAGRGMTGVRPTNPVVHTVPGIVVDPWVEARLPTAPSLARRARRKVRRTVRGVAGRAGQAR